MKIQHLMALAVLILATVSGARAAVLAGPITNAATAHAYYLLSSNTWTASEAEAVGLGGHLVTINDAAENQWVLNTFFPLTGVPYSSLWIGLNDAAYEGQFVWANGEPVTFTYWYPDEPNNAGPGGEDYATIRHPSEAPPTGSWNDLANTPSAQTFGVVEVLTPLPLAVTQPADQFTPGSAQLNGQANPNGSSTLAWFEWGTSLAYGNITPPQSVGSGSNAVGLSNVIVGLAIGTDYHFRARASNAFGSLAGLDQTFNLSNQLPVVTTLAADQLTTNSARLRGQVNPRGSLTTAWFEWGTDTNYGNVIGMQDAGQGSSVSNLNVVLNGLKTGTNYHYRLVATNAFGAGYGANQTFNPGQRLKTNTWTGADPSGYWSAPANWSPTGVPVNGDDLVFPGGLPPGDMVSTNDLIDSSFRSITFSGASRHTIRGNPMTITNRADCIINSGTNVIACDLTFSGTPPLPPYPQFGTITIRGTFNSGELTLSGNVGGGSLVPYGNRLVLRGQFTGGSIRAFAGDLALYGDNPYAVTTEFKNGTLFIQGSQPNLNLQMLWEFESAACPYLIGGGVIGDVLGCGHIVLDSTFSVKSLGGAGASTYGWRVLDIHLNGTNVGEYGQLISSGAVTLSGGSLSASAGFNPQPGQVFTIVDKISPGPITTVPGYDTNLFGPEGKIITLNGTPFRLSYVGGDGNDVTLTANTPPVVAWQQPANNAAFPTGFTLSLRAQATDSDGTVSNLNFFATPTNGPTINVGQGTLASDGYYVRGWTNPPPGQYQLHAEAVDNAGGRGTSGWVQIVVVGTNQGPNAQTRTWTGADPSGNWSAPANWSPSGVLVNGDALVFPGGLPPGDMVSTNDLTDRIFRSITFSGASRHTIRGNPITLTNPEFAIINDGTNVIACDLTFTGTPVPPTPPTIWNSSFDSGELTVIGNVGAGSLYIGAGFWRLVIMGQFTGSFEMNWYATLALYGDNPYAVSAVVVGSTLLVQGSQPNLNITMYWNQEAQLPAILSGNGLVGDVTGGTSSTRITPDSTLSARNISGGLSTLVIRLNGTNVGEYSRLVASGNVSLNGGSLTPSPGFNPQPGLVFTIVEKTSPGPIATAFLGPEGKIITLNKMPFRISYVGGDGNDVTLTATPPRLDIARTNPATVRLSWPTNYPGFQLLRASAIDGSAPWSNHPMSPVVMGSNYTVTQPAATNREFFRLKVP